LFINVIVGNELCVNFRYDEALELLDNIIKRDETNAAPRKRRVAILKAKGRITEAIKELTEYLKK
jgi:transcription elongation factor GreA-like protein